MIGEKASDMIKEDWPENKSDVSVQEQLNGSLAIDVNKFSLKKKKKFMETLKMEASSSAQPDSLG
jgi:hypothetical protein